MFLNSHRQRLLLAAACSLVAFTPRVVAAPASTATEAGQPAPAPQPETVIVKAAKRRLLKEKNSPSAVTELGQAQISAASVAASTGQLLRQAPSVYVYQQGLGDNAPELTIRGIRGLEIATTLDGVPTQDLEAPGASYLANNIGSNVTTSQINGVSIYPGVAYPDKSTFGTIGGTVAYSSKRPTNDEYLDVTGSIGSFGTYKEGFEINSGAVDSPLGTGDNAAKLLLQYNNLQTQGFIDGTPSRENEMLFAFDKPYNDGLSKFSVTAIYNTSDGLIENEPVPLPYLEKYGKFSNYPTNLVFAKENNDFGTLIVNDQHYINDYVTAQLTGFLLNNSSQLETYGAPQLFLPGADLAAGAGPLTVNGSSPFINNPAGFGEGGLFGPPGGAGGALGIYGGGYGGYFYGKGNTYNPGQYYNNPKACPQSIISAYGGAGNSPCGLNDQITGSESTTYGIRPSFLISPPDIFGITNTIKVGGLFAKETTPGGYTYLGAFPNTPQDAANLSGATFQSLNGGSERTIYQGYLQDKIDLFDNTLHITPGATLEGTKSSLISGGAFCASATEACARTAPAYGPGGAFGPNGALSTGGTGTNLDKYGFYKATKWDREPLPFFNISYDLDKILPVAKGVSFYGSFANSALFAPVTDFGPNSAGTPPYASIVHMYEAGVKYNVSNVSLTADYFYQKIDRDFGFFQFQSGPQNGESEFSNSGQREFKGVEVAGQWQVTPDVQLFGNFSHQLAKFLTSGFAFDTVAEDQFGIENKGAPISGVPDYLANFGVAYDHKSTFLDGDDARIRFAGQYTGHQYTSYDYGGNDYLTIGNFTGLSPLNYAPNAALGYNGCGALTLNHNAPQSCAAYTRYNQVTGATTTDTSGKGISPFVIFNVDATYELPTPQWPVIKKLTFNANVQNLFNHFYYQYFYHQISPGSCGNFTSGSFYDPKNTAQKGLAQNNYSCGPEFADGIPGQPFSVFFSVTARF